MEDKQKLTLIGNDYVRSTYLSFTTLCFATLGLSVQFSPGYGHELPWLLVLSWVLLFSSGIIGGSRIFDFNSAILANALKNNLHHNYSSYISLRQDPVMNQLKDDSLIPVKYTGGAAVSKIQVLETASKAEQAIEKLDKQMSKYNDGTPFWMFAQITCFAGGVSFNGIFAAYNYLNAAANRC